MKKEWKKKASFEYRIPNIFCTFKLFIGNKYKILLPTPVFIICTSNNGNIYTVCFSLQCGQIIKLAVKLPCGSASISNTFLPSLASPMPTFTVVVVFPTPPFWFTTDITLHMISSSFNFPMILFSIISTVPVFPVSSLPVYKNLENTCATARL